jgi:hypothetical protein
MDESSKQVHGEKREAVPMQSGQVKRKDYAYEQQEMCKSVLLIMRDRAEAHLRSQFGEHPDHQQSCQWVASPTSLASIKHRL